MTLALYLVGLTVVWVLAWGSLTWANVLGGIAVGLFVLRVAPGAWPRRRPVTVRLGPTFRLAWYVVSSVVKSNGSLVISVMAPSRRVHTGVIAVPLSACGEGVITLIANIVALTPGTSPVHVSHDPTVLYVHVLDMRDVDAVRADVEHLAALAIAAFGPWSTPA